MLQRPCEGCGKMTALRIRKMHKFLIFSIGGKWHSACPECAPAVIELKDPQPTEIPQHVLQEYNERGNVCHFPGCTMTVEEHPKEIKK